MQDNKVKLFSPGPVPLSVESLKILAAPPLHHRSHEFQQILSETIKNLPLLFDEEHVAVMTSTGSGALEASIVNFLNSHSPSLSLDGGKFGERWSEILQAYKVPHQVYKFPWGETPKAQKLQELVTQIKPQALMVQACETSTATAYDLQEISQILKTKSPDSLFIVDGITAVGAYPLSMKEMGIDVLLSGSQKALGLPTGLSLMGFSNRALEASKKSDLPKFYFDVLKESQNLKNNASTFSTPTQLWEALGFELNRLKEEGLNRKFEQVEKLQKQVLLWTQKMKLDVFSSRPSPSLTAISLPSELSAKKIQKKLVEKNYFVAVGQGEIKDRVIRVGHMANITPEEMSDFLNTLENILVEEGYKN